MKILILCTGNSCRSQMAYGFLRSFSQELEVYSAGTHPATEVHPMAIEVMKEAGIDISDETPTDIACFTNEKWDYVITVCDRVHSSCPTFSGQVDHRIHIGFEDPSESTGSYRDKYDAFIRTRDDIRERLHDFYLSELRPKLK